jgi:CRISPR-associated protein Cas2
MLYWVIYDISKNSIRKRVSDKCKDYGLSRVQKSAFLGELTKNKSEMLMTEIQGCTDNKSSDCIFLIPQCKDCFSSREIIGSFDEELIKDREFVYLATQC